MTLAFLDGRFVASDRLPPPDPGRLAPFETMGARDGQLPLWSRHLHRLRAAAARAGLGSVAAGSLRAAAGKLLVETGRFDGILRLALVPVGDVTHVVMTTRPRSPATSVRLAPVELVRPAAAPPADLKAGPRAFYDAVLQQAQDAGADDGIVVDEDQAALETATANLWALLDGVWYTPPLDGRVLPGIARALLLEQGQARGVGLREQALTVERLRAAEALAVSNAVYGPRPAVLLGEGPPATPRVAGTLGTLWTISASG